MAHIPSYPALLARPFADAGNRRQIPESTGDSGRASLATGFPPETQLPLTAGGIAPNRLDFNGAFNMVSSMLFWAQSGGQWKYAPDLGYTSPAIVFHNGNLWWCLKENGPENAEGVREPGTNDEYWEEFIRALGGMSTGGGSVFGSPVGTVIMYYGTVAPEGYLACDGKEFDVTEYPGLFAHLGLNRTPNFQGLAPRGYDPQGTVDPQGTSRGIGSKQDCALERMTGWIKATVQGSGQEQYSDGRLITNSDIGSGDTGEKGGEYRQFSFDSKRAVRSDSETRMANFSILYAIKW